MKTASGSSDTGTSGAAEGTLEDAAEVPEEALPPLPRRRRIARIAARVLFWTPLIFLTLLYATVDDRFWWSEYFAIWPPLLWLFVLVPVAPLGAVLRDWRWAGVAGAAVLLFALVFVEWLPLLRGKATVPDNAVRVVTWNVQGANGRRLLQELARLPEADLYLLTESPDGALSLDDPQLDGRWEGWHWLDGGDAAILSRWPLEALSRRRIGPWDEPMPALVQAPDGPLIAVSVRLMLPSLIINPLRSVAREQLRRDHAARFAQFEELAVFLEETRALHPDMPLILGGDFNTPAHSRALAPLSVYTDSWESAGSGWGRTMTTQFPVARIDYVYAGEGLEPVTATVPETAFSDHLPVFAALVRR